jgi:diguanylate cyclase (GGDEF)-like protein
MRALRRHRSLAVSITLVLALGVAGLWAGRQAGSQAEATHRSDRLALQVTLAGLTGQYSQVAAAEILDIVAAQSRAGAPAWSGVLGSPADTAHLRAVAEGSRALGAGAALVSTAGVLVSYAPAGRQLPPMTDPGWRPLREAALSGGSTLPVSDVLTAGDVRVVAVAVPVGLAAGGQALLVGLSDLRSSPLQKYVEKLVNTDGRRGYVVDGRGLVIAAPTHAEVGRPLRFQEVLPLLGGAAPGIRDVDQGRETYTASYARAGSTPWSAVTVQDADRFLGELRTASRRAQAALVLLLLIAGTAMVVLHRKRETALRDAAVTDELTGLYNRRGWFAIANHELERARRSGERRGLLFLDVDGLKQVNDALGHREGDRAIAAAADVLRGCARASDVLGRLGGDEFVLLLGDVGAPDVVRRRVLDALVAHNAQSGSRFELRLSIGAEVWYPEAATSLDELVQLADRQMYADKSARPHRHDGLVRSLPAGVVPHQKRDGEVRQ